MQTAAKTLVILLVISLWGTAIPAAKAEIQFSDISESSGITQGNFVIDATGIPINDHSRIRLADIDNNGFDDLIATSLYPNAKKGIPFETLVFLNNGDGTFTDFSEESGLKDVQAAFHLFADFDNDGDQDAFAGLDYVREGHPNNQILLNDGTGHFARLHNSGVEWSFNLTTACAVAADFDGDAILDLFVGNGSSEIGQIDLIFRGMGDGTFEYLPEALPETDVLRGKTNGCTTLDYDNDGDQDIYVTSYGVSLNNGHDLLWENQGNMRFRNVGYARGIASMLTGNYWSTDPSDLEPDKDIHTSMGGNGFGPAVGDVNNDGNLDIFIANISHPHITWSDPSLLLINDGSDTDYGFTNAYLSKGLPFNEGDVDGSMVDVNNDGLLDIAVSRENKYEGTYSGFDQKGWFGLFRQERDGTFTSVGASCGINDLSGDTLRMKKAQNHSWSDINHDGLLDLFVGGRDTGGGRANFLFKNISDMENHFLAIKLEGDGKNVNRDGIGTRIIIEIDQDTITRELTSARGSYSDQDSRWLHFGLGDNTQITAMTVQWPDGTIQDFDPSQITLDTFLRLKYEDTHESEEKGLMGSWELEANGLDSSANGRDGQIIGTLPFTTGVIGQAGRFGVRGQYVKIPDYTAFNGLKSFTLSAWIKPTAHTDYACIISKANPNRDFALQLTDGKINAHFATAYNRYFSVSGQNEIPLDKWSHVVAVWTGIAWKLYQDGSLIAEKEFSGHEPLWTGTRMGIGTLDWSNPFIGELDEVKIYGQALSDVQVRKLYETPHPKGIWLFEGTARDSSTSNADGILVNGAAFSDGKVGQGITLTGNAHVEITENTAFDDMDAFTLCAWIYPTSYDSYNGIISKVNPNRDFVLQIYNGRLNAHFAPNANNYISVSDNDRIALNQWTHVAAVWTGSKWQLYRNGGLISETPSDSAPSWTGTLMEIGSMNNLYNFTGKIDEVKIFSGILDHRQIHAEYRNGNAENSP